VGQILPGAPNSFKGSMERSTTPLQVRVAVGRGVCQISRVDYSLAWLIAGLALAISELLTGTFYLLMLGIAAFGAAAAAYLGLDFGPQIVVAAVVAAAGCYAVHAYRQRNGLGRCRPSTPACPRASSTGSTRRRALRVCAIAARSGTHGSKVRKRWSLAA